MKQSQGFLITGNTATSADKAILLKVSIPCVHLIVVMTIYGYTLSNIYIRFWRVKAIDSILIQGSI